MGEVRDGGDGGDGGDDQGTKGTEGMEENNGIDRNSMVSGQRKTMGSIVIQWIREEELQASRL